MVSYTLVLQFHLKNWPKKKNVDTFLMKKKTKEKKNSTIMRSVHGKGADFSSEVELIRKVILIKILKKRVLKKI